MTEEINPDLVVRALRKTITEDNRLSQLSGLALAFAEPLPAGQAQMVLSGAINAQSPTHVGEPILPLIGLEPTLRTTSDFNKLAACTTAIASGLSRAWMNDSGYKPENGALAAYGSMLFQLATQSPTTAFRIIDAVLSEPTVPSYVIDTTAMTLANASFKLLRTHPAETLNILGQVSQHANDSRTTMTTPTRASLAEKLVSEIERVGIAPAGMPIPLGRFGMPEKIAAEVAQQAYRYAAAITSIRNDANLRVLT